MMETYIVLARMRVHEDCRPHGKYKSGGDLKRVTLTFNFSILVKTVTFAQYLLGVLHN